VAQFEKLWGDMTARPRSHRDSSSCLAFATAVKRSGSAGRWRRDGSAEVLESICQWQRARSTRVRCFNLNRGRLADEIQPQ